MLRAPFPPSAPRTKGRFDHPGAGTIVRQTVRTHVRRNGPLWNHPGPAPRTAPATLTGPRTATSRPSRAIGAGPDRIAAFEPGGRLVSERSDDVRGPQAPLARAGGVRISETASRVAVQDQRSGSDPRTMARI